MRYLVLLLVCLAAVIAYVQRTALTVPTRTIQADLGISERQMGLVMGCWYWAYAVLQIPAGWATDRLGSKRALVFFVVAWSGLTGLAGLANGFVGLLLLWSLVGLAQTGLVPGAAKAIGGWFPPTGRAFGSGMLGASMALGGAVAPLVAAWLLRWFAWREVLGLYVLPGLVWAFCFAVIVPGRQGPSSPPAPLGETFARMLASPPMILLCAQQFFRAAAMALFFTWFPRFLQEMFRITESESGQLAMWPGLAAMVGGVFGGFVSDAILHHTGNRRLSRQGVAVVGMFCCTAFALYAYFLTDVRAVIALISLAAFCGTFGGVSGYSVCIDFGGRRVGTVISVMNTCGNVGAGLFPFAVGHLVTETGRWDLVLPLFAGIFAIDGVCWAILNPQRPLFEEADGPS
jgi:sugar phosphate permease